MGRPRTPTAKLMAAGTYRQDRHGGNEPQPDGEPIKPKWLDGVAAEAWQRVVPELVALGVARTIDADALAGMCRWFAVWREADAKLQAGDGDTYKRTIEAATGWKNYTAIAAKYGMTPADRAKLTIDTDDAGDDLLEYLRLGPGGA